VAGFCEHGNENCGFCVTLVIFCQAKRPFASRGVCSVTSVEQSPCSAEAKNAWSRTSASPYACMMWFFINLTF
jgi:hypothetical protein